MPVTFRKQASAGARTEARVIQTYCEAARLFELISDRSGYKTSELPDPQDFAHDPTACAEAVRDLLGIGPTAPVLNVTRALERLGVGVLDHLDPQSVQPADHVSISRPANATARPLVAMVNGNLPGAVQRLSLAHLMLDRDRVRPIAGSRSVEEHRAYDFAGAFLVPDQVLRRAISDTVTLQGYLRVKAEYGISVAALIMRARRLGVIGSTRARSLQIQLSSQGWRTHEPVEVPAERCLLFGHAYRRVFGDRPIARVSDDTGHARQLLAHWLGDRESQTSDTSPVIDLQEWRAQPGRASTQG